MINIRSIAADEGLLLRKLRLGALKDSPDSFSPLYENYVDRDDSYWISLAERTAATENFRFFFAERGDTPCGLVSGYADADSVGHIGAMWASPDVRGTGVGKALLNHVLGYLEDQGCQTIKLTVTETNQTAISLYTGLGFAMTGNSEPLREGSSLENLEMAR
jgi:ribosomal protein S18 acetylase RimI-like enzyme